RCCPRWPFMTPPASPPWWRPPRRPCNTTFSKDARACARASFLNEAAITTPQEAPMPTDTITSRDNPRIKHACAVRDAEKQRAADGVFFAEGPKLCLELAKGCRLRALFATEAALGRTPALAAFADRTTPVAPHVAEKLAGTRSSQDVFALFETPSTDPAPLLAEAR